MLKPKGLRGFTGSIFCLAGDAGKPLDNKHPEHLKTVSNTRRPPRPMLVSVFTLGYFCDMVRLENQSGIHQVWTNCELLEV